MKIRRSIAIGTFAVALSVLAIPALAAGAEQDDGGIPSTAVARLKIGKGTAWVRPGDSGEWQESSTNYTLAERTRVSVPQGSEAEIQFRGSQSLLLRGGSEVDIRQLGEKEVSYRLRSGQAVLSLPKEDFAPVRIKVPEPARSGWTPRVNYTLSTDRGITKFLVRAGEGAVTSGKGPPTAVKAGEEASIGEEIRVSRVDIGGPGDGPGGGAVDRGGGSGGDPSRRGRRAAAIRRVGLDSGVRVRLAAVRGRRLGAVLLRAVVLGLAVRMDLGRL